MKTMQAGLQTGTPQLAIAPLDPNRPLCRQVYQEAPGDVRICTRGPHHDGPCYGPPTEAA